MKKVMFIALAACVPLLVQAQEAPESKAKADSAAVKEFTLGAMAAVVTTHSFNQKGIIMSGVVSPSLKLATLRTEHRIMLNVGDNALETQNGYRFHHEWSAYVLLSKNLARSDGYAAVGIEKTKVVAEGFDFVIFAEFGTDFLGTQSFAFGLYAYPQFSLKKERRKEK